MRKRTHRKFVCKNVSILLLLGLFMGMASLMGCGAGNSTMPSPVLKGNFVDGPVAGLNYRTRSLEGVTDAEGEFHYRNGETVTFAAGEIILGSAKGKSFLTPVDLAGGISGSANMKAVNISRFLQLVDADGDHANGIEITEGIRELLLWDAADGVNDGSIFKDDLSIFVGTGPFAVFLNKTLNILKAADVFAANKTRTLLTRTATGARRNFDATMTLLSPPPYSPYVKEVGIGVTNLNQSMLFYQNILGMDFVDYQGKTDRVEAIYEDNRITAKNRLVLMLFNDTGINCKNRPVKLVFAVPDVQATYDAIKAGGGSGFIDPSYPLGSANKVAMALDPDGYMIELLEYPVPGSYLTGIGIGVINLEPVDDFYTRVVGMRLKYYLYVPGFMNEVILQSRLSPSYDVSYGMDVVLMDYFNDTGKDYHNVPAKIAYTVSNPEAVASAISAEGLPIIQSPGVGVRGVAKDALGYELELVQSP